MITIGFFFSRKHNLQHQITCLPLLCLVNQTSLRIILGVIVPVWTFHQHCSTMLQQILSLCAYSLCSHTIILQSPLLSQLNSFFAFRCDSGNHRVLAFTNPLAPKPIVLNGSEVILSFPFHSPNFLLTPKVYLSLFLPIIGDSNGFEWLALLY